MEIVISLKRGSPIDTAWRRHNRIGGEVEGLRFGLQKNVFVAVAAPLPGIMEKLSHNPSVLIEAFAVAPPAVESLRIRLLHGEPR